LSRVRDLEGRRTDEAKSVHRGAEDRRAARADAKRLKQLEDENARLKKLPAEAMLDNAVLKDITSRKC
jgi:hypothetical protein